MASIFSVSLAQPQSSAKLVLTTITALPAFLATSIITINATRAAQLASLIRIASIDLATAALPIVPTAPLPATWLAVQPVIQGM